MAEHLFLMAAKATVLLLGTAIAFLSYLAYRRNGGSLMLALSVGFALIAIGAFLEGLLFELLGWDLATVHLVESAFVFGGLVTLAIVLRPRGVKG
ncbi:MAG: hypothetical protein V3U70_03180 [Thermoplasmata archaeon]|jgi:hypothetical protein